MKTGLDAAGHRFERQGVMISERDTQIAAIAVANKRLEIIFRVLDDTPGGRLRTPHRDIAGKVRIIGDMINTVPEIDWDLPG